FIEKPDMLMTFPLIKVEEDKYASEMLNPYMFKDSKLCGFILYSDTIQKYVLDIKPTFISPNSNNIIFSADSLCSVNTTNTNYNATLMWITKYAKLLKINSKNRKSNIYKLHPYGIPFKNSAVISLSVNNDINLEHCSIYIYNKKKTKWDFVKSYVDTINNTINTISNIPNIFTVLEDTRPPNFLYTYPHNQKTYSRNTLNKLIITLNDDLSDIDPSEENLEVYLDRKRIWVAYQPIKKEISYFFSDLLVLGEHNLLINIQDRSGNLASKTIKFFVK
ncbi:MAG: hypothetical protein V3W20_05590, partial [Candidatus Neomarinimicrobiota bacterium]